MIRAVRSRTYSGEQIWHNNRSIHPCFWHIYGINPRSRYSSHGTHKQSWYMTFSAGLANAVPSTAATLYRLRGRHLAFCPSPAKPISLPLLLAICDIFVPRSRYAKSMACCQCPDSGEFIPSGGALRVPGAWTEGLHLPLAHRCATNGNRAGTDGLAVLFCYHDPADPSCPFSVEIHNNAGLLLFLGILFLVALYLGAGTLIGTTRKPRARGERRLARHPHYRNWLELYALCLDGVAFTSGSLGLSHRERDEPLLAAAGDTAAAAVHRPLVRPSSSTGSSASMPSRKSSAKAEDAPSSASGGGKGSRRVPKKAKSKGAKKDAPSSTPSESSERAMPPVVAAAEAARLALQEERQGGVHSSQQAVKVKTLLL